MNHKTKIAAIVALAAAASMLFSACSPECVDLYDCPTKGSQSRTCTNNACKYTSSAADAGK